MGNTKERKPGHTNYAIFLTSDGKHFIIFPDLYHTLPSVST